MAEVLIEKLTRVSTSPGVYLMKSTTGQIIYVGKARNLKKRLSSYFNRPSHPDMKSGVLIKQIADFETIITATEKEALILESTLIKRYRPRYNVLLKDDKRYPVLKLDVKEDYPNLAVVRKIKNDGALYFGPYASPGAVRQTLKFIHKTFRLRKCRSKNVKPRTRPCLHCQIEGCLAPCCMEVDRQEYHEIVKEVILFLKGRTPELIHNIKKEMLQAAEVQEFEKAARLRDKMFALTTTLEKQVTVTTDFIDRDVLAVGEKHGIFLINKLVIRSGFLVGSHSYDFEDKLANKAEILEAFIKQHYETSHFIPREILIPFDMEETSVLEEWLGGLKKQKVHIVYPRRGEKARLMNMADQNAKNAMEELLVSLSSNINILAHLQKCLHMNRPPVRIECFDNSNISGSEPVSAMVVFENAKPKKSAYRKFHIKTVTQPDDYAYMNEVLKRRYGGKGEKSDVFPDLLMVDGGKGQLNIAMSVLKDLELTGRFYVIGISKKDTSRGETQDKIYIPGRVNPVNISGEHLLFLQRIRDEAHRFAIAFHRKQRQKTTLHSILDDIPGIGKKRKQALLKHFGSMAKIRKAKLDELIEVAGLNKTAAEEVYKAMRPDTQADAV
ncbi:MAG: excinuclease ABC subunit UvrC [Desulfobacterales bacterium]